MTTWSVEPSMVSLESYLPYDDDRYDNKDTITIIMIITFGSDHDTRQNWKPITSVHNMKKRQDG